MTKPADSIRPFLPFVATTTRSLGSALPAIATPEVTSPWLPKPSTPAAAATVSEPAGPTAAEIAMIIEESRARGRAEGLAETEGLRVQLAGVLEALREARREVIAPTAELIGDLATCVVEAWLGTTDRSVLFAPVIRGWLARSPSQPATARVHPQDAAALTQALGDAPIAIEPDAQIARGAIEIRSATLELAHDWRARIDELRTAMVAALSTADHDDASEDAAASDAADEATGADDDGAGGTA